jgi:hypothetical protein
MRKTVMILAILAAAGAVFNLITIPIFHEEVFVQLEGISAVEIIMLLAYLIIFVFNIISIIRLILLLHREKPSKISHVFLLILAFICMIGLIGQKVMLDEVAHEYDLGWSVQVEFYILMGLLGLQLVYALVTGAALVREKD